METVLLAVALCILGLIAFIIIVKLIKKAIKSIRYRLYMRKKERQKEAETEAEKTKKVKQVHLLFEKIKSTLISEIKNNNPDKIIVKAICITFVKNGVEYKSILFSDYVSHDLETYHRFTVNNYNGGSVIDQTEILAEMINQIAENSYNLYRMPEKFETQNTYDGETMCLWSCPGFTLTKK